MREFPWPETYVDPFQDACDQNWVFNACMDPAPTMSRYALAYREGAELMFRPLAESAGEDRGHNDLVVYPTTDPLTGRTVLTNLRLPGQYDERMRGQLGLQGPYYNWNRWYLPGVGRYLDLDPVALAGGFSGQFGPDYQVCLEQCIQDGGTWPIASRLTGERCL